MSLCQQPLRQMEEIYGYWEMEQSRSIPETRYIVNWLTKQVSLCPPVRPFVPPCSIQQLTSSLKGGLQLNPVSYYLLDWPAGAAVGINDTFRVRITESHTSDDI